MMHPSAAFLALLAAAPSAVALKAAQEPGLQCGCLQWDYVYANMGVKCGQGLEFYAWLGNKHSLYKDDHRLEEVRYNLGDEFCAKFWEKQAHNRAFKMKFNTPPSEAGKPWDRSWCYVSPECGLEHLNGGDYVPNTGVHLKFANEEEEDKQHDIIAAHMAAPSLIRASKLEGDGKGFDLSMLLGYSYYKDIAEGSTVSRDLLEETRRKFLPIVLQPQDHLADRYIVDGGSYYRMFQNPAQRTDAPGTWWNANYVDPGADLGPESLLKPWVPLEKGASSRSSRGWGAFEAPLKSEDQR